jgi:uncharacterized protein
MSASGREAMPPERAARILLRPIGNPLPLGFLALSAATLLVSGLQLGWLQATDGAAVALILLAFVFPLQLLASIFGFLGRDLVAGTGMGVLAGTWLSVALVTLDSEPGATSDALGLFLLIAGVAMLIPASAASTGKVVPTLVLTTTSVRFATTGLYQLTASGTWEDLAGIIGLILCALALYAALAMALEDAWRAPVLPLARREGGEEALTGGLDAQLEGIESEAGVRQQL